MPGDNLIPWACWLEASMSKLTIYLARLFGVVTLLVVAAMYLKGGGAIAAAASDSHAMLMYGIPSVGIGVAMVLGHNVWSRGLLAAVVTLLGWIILAKGLLLL